MLLLCAGLRFFLNLAHNSYWHERAKSLTLEQDSDFWESPPPLEVIAYGILDMFDVGVDEVAVF